MTGDYRSNEPTARREHDEMAVDPIRARQGVTGHNVRYVLGFGIAAVVILFAIGYAAVRGYFGA
jgi:hypothetical protein